MTMNRQQGMTIAGLLVGLAVGLILTAAMISAFVLSVRGSSDVRNAARLNQDLRVAMERMVSDIRRAGFWGAATTFEWGVTENPFTGVVTDLTIDEQASEDVDSCITFSYDFDIDGVVDYGSEGYGFRLRSGAVEARSATTGAAAMGCADSDGTWEQLTDPEVVTIDGMMFRVLADRDDAGSPASQCLNTTTGASWESLCGDTVWCNASDCTGENDYTAPTTGDRLVETRLVEITLSGTLVADNPVRKQLREYVKVRNNRMILTP